MPDVQPQPQPQQAPTDNSADSAPTPSPADFQSALAGNQPSVAAQPQPDTAPAFKPGAAEHVRGLLQGLFLGGAPGAIAGAVDPRMPARALRNAQVESDAKAQAAQNTVKFQSVQAAKMQVDLAASRINLQNLPHEIQQQYETQGVENLQRMQQLGMQPTLITEDTPQAHQAALQHLDQTRGGVPPMAYLHVGGQLVGFDLSQGENAKNSYNVVSSMAPVMALPEMSMADWQKLPREKQIDMAQQALTFWQPTVSPTSYKEQISNYQSLKATYMAAHPNDPATAAKFDKTIDYIRNAGAEFFAQHQKELADTLRIHQQAAINEAMTDTGEGSIASQLVNGTLDPSQLSKRGKDYTALLQSANEYSLQKYGKPFDAAKAQGDYKFATNPATQNTLKYLNSLTGADNKGGNLKSLVDLSNGISRSRFPSLNDAAGWARLQAGDPAMASYHTAVTEVADQVAKILQGGGSGNGTSDAKLKQAADLFRQGFSKDQINSVAGTLRDLLTNRKTELIGDNRYLQRQFGQAAAPAQSAAPSNAAPQGRAVRDASGNLLGYTTDGKTMTPVGGAR